MTYPNPNIGGGSGVTVDNITDAGTTGKAVLKSEPPSAAQNALGLGNAATKTVGTAAGNVMAVGAFGLGRGANHKGDAYNNIGEIYRVNSTSVNAPGGSVYGVLSLPCDGGPSSGYFAASNNGSAWIGYSNVPGNSVKWNRVYTDAYKPNATPIVSGFVKQSTLVANSTATDIAGLNAKINELLAALKASGQMTTAASTLEADLNAPPNKPESLA